MRCNNAKERRWHHRPPPRTAATTTDSCSTISTATTTILLSSSSSSCIFLKMAIRVLLLLSVVYTDSIRMLLLSSFSKSGSRTYSSSYSGGLFVHGGAGFVIATVTANGYQYSTTLTGQRRHPRTSYPNNNNNNKLGGVSLLLSINPILTRGDTNKYYNSKQQKQFRRFARLSPFLLFDNTKQQQRQQPEVSFLRTVLHSTRGGDDATNTNNNDDVTTTGLDLDTKDTTTVTNTTTTTTTTTDVAIINNNESKKNDGSSHDTIESSSSTPTSSSTAIATVTEVSITSSKAQIQPPLSYNSSAFDVGSTKIENLIEQLETSVSDGLSVVEVQRRQNQYGYNVLQKAPPKSIWILIAEQFEDRLVQILVVVALLSSIFSFAEVIQHGGTSSSGGSVWKFFVEPFVIVSILLINAAVGVWQSQSANDSLASLEQLQAAVCCVIRENGTILDNEPASNLVPGDIIIVRTGDKIPADGRVLSIQTALLNVDETSLTGESVTVSKLAGNEGTSKVQGAVLQEQKGTVFAGTVVTRGTAKVLVTATGMNTQFGQIQKGVVTAQAEQIQTPLTIKLNEFASSLTIIIGIICAAVWIVNIPKFNDSSFDGQWYKGAIYYAKVAVALGVAAIPEGLPAVITLCLSLGTRRMASQNVIVRKLPSVETLGCTTVICTDKTGTLTTNEMTAVSLIVFEKNNTATTGTKVTVTEHTIEGYSYSPIGTIDGITYHSELHTKPRGSIADIAAVSALCNDAKIIGNDYNIVPSNSDDTSTTANSSKNNNNNGSTVVVDESKMKLFERVGEPTEAALCVLVEKIGGMSNSCFPTTSTTVATTDSTTSYTNNNREAPIVTYDTTGMHVNAPNSILATANVNTWRTLYPRIATLEFSRDRKSMSVLCSTSGAKQSGLSSSSSSSNSNTNRLFVKGAPNLLLERCSYIKLRDGTVMKLNGSLRRDIQAKISELAQRPLRCIALAVKEHDTLDDSLRKLSPSSSSSSPVSNTDGTSSSSSSNGGMDMSKHPLLSDPNNYKAIESGLTLVGVVGIKDPARPGVADSIEQCTKAGIRVIMITGDAKDTAVAIAKDVHIFPQNTNDPTIIKAYEGREFFNKPSREQLDILKEGNIVFCRAEPADKQKLIKILQQQFDEITAMTGDGVNDAPALQQAAIGVAMGITGTEVAKEASDMILTDDNFSTIVTAVQEGRRIYANMQAFICFLISCNIGEICAIFLATLAGFPEPLTAMHLLWVNLVTDGPPATALGFNPAAPGIMSVPPRPTDEPIMTRWLLTRYCITGLYVGLATIGVFAQHYMAQGITLGELASWSQCGVFWSPKSGMDDGVMEVTKLCNGLFQGDGRMLPQTLALTTLVCMEMIKALCAVSVDNSIFQIGPQQNPWLLYAVAGPFLLHVFVVYSSALGFPAIGESLGLVPLSGSDWINVLCWSIPILLVDEILKAIGRWIYREERAKRAKLVAAAKSAI